MESKKFSNQGPSTAMRIFFGLAVLTVGMTAVRYWVLTKAVPTPDVPETQSRMFFANGLAMGSTYDVKAVVPDHLYPIENLDSDILKFLRDFNTKFSTYDPNSEVSQFNKSTSTEWFSVTKEVAELTQMSQELSEKCDGAFDITVGPLVDLWSFGPDKRPRKVPSDEEIAQARALVGYKRLEVRLDPPAIRKTIPGLRIDYNSIAAGYAGDLIGKMLEARGLTNYLVDIGGEIKVSGEKAPGKAWTIAIEKPSADDESEASRTIRLKDISISTAGDYRNYFEENGIRYSHTIDLSTGKPIAHRLSSVTVLETSCAMADGLDTVLMAMGPDAGYDWAIKNNVPVYMVVKGDDGFYEKITPSFQEVLAKSP